MSVHDLQGFSVIVVTWLDKGVPRVRQDAIRMKPLGRSLRDLANVARLLQIHVSSLPSTSPHVSRPNGHVVVVEPSSGYKIMLDYEENAVLEIAGCSCDGCRQGVTPVDFEFHERLSVRFLAGFDSIFGDGNVVSIDLCPRCLKETPGDLLHITPPDGR